MTTTPPLGGAAAHSNKWLNLALLAALVFVILEQLVWSVVSPGNHNENVYVAAGVLLNQGQRLYQDFTFPQTPYVPYLYAALFRLTGAHVPYLLAAHLLTCALTLLATAILYWTARILGSSRTISLTVAILFACNTLVLKGAQEASNYVPSLTAALFAFHFFARHLRSPRRTVHALLAGAFSSIAIGLKLYYLPHALCLGLALALSEPSPRRLRAISFYAIGLLIGIFPAALLFIRCPDQFLFCNLTFHRLVSTVHYSTVGALALEWATLLAKLSIENAVPLLLAIILVVLLPTWPQLRGQLRPPWADVSTAGILACVVLAACGLAVSLYMRPPWSQYFLQIVPYLLLLIPLLEARLPHDHRRDFAHGFLACGLLASLIISVFFIKNTLRTELSTLASSAGRSETSRTLWHTRLARELAQRVAAEGVSGPVASLDPLLPLQARLPHYPEFAGGLFAFYMGDTLTPEQRQRYHITSRSTVNQLLTRTPPAAVVVGTYWDEEKPLADYAIAHGYREHTISFGIVSPWSPPPITYRIFIRPRTSINSATP